MSFGVEAQPITEYFFGYPGLTFNAERKFLMKRKRIEAESSRPRPSAPKRIYGLLHTMVVAAMRRLPIPSKVFGPPKGVIPDMKEWIAEYRSKRPDSHAECWYSTVRQPVAVLRRPPNTLFPDSPLFLDEQTRPEPEIFHACIPDARIIIRNGLVISPDDYVFEQSCSWGRRLFPSDIEYNSLRRKLKSRRLGGSYTTIFSRSWRSYYHWFSECLTRLPVAEGLPESKICVPSNLSSWHRQSLALLGTRDERLLELDNGCYEVERLYFPSFPGVTGHMAGWPFRQLREKFRAGHTSRHPNRIYVSRNGTPYRRVVNEDELIRALEPEGFMVVEGHKLLNRRAGRAFRRRGNHRRGARGRSDEYSVRTRRDNNHRSFRSRIPGRLFLWHG